MDATNDHFDLSHAVQSSLDSVFIQFQIWKIPRASFNYSPNSFPVSTKCCPLHLDKVGGLKSLSHPTPTRPYRRLLLMTSWGPLKASWGPLVSQIEPNEIIHFNSTTNWPNNNPIAVRIIVPKPILNPKRLSQHCPRASTSILLKISSNVCLSTLNMDLNT